MSEIVLQKLSDYAKKGTLIPAEQILQSTLIDFEKQIDINNLNEDSFNKIEKLLFNVLDINKGKLSFQCSIRIATCLLSIYKTSTPPKIWNLITFVCSKPTPSNVIAVGFVIDKIGKSCKSVITGLAQKLVSMTSGDLLFPAIYALKQCYKRDRIDLDKISAKAFTLAKKGVDSNNEHIILSSIKLLSSLVRQQNEISQKKILSLATDILKIHENFNYIFSSYPTSSKNSANSFILDQACFLIAKVAYITMDPLNKEFQICYKKDQNKDESDETNNTISTDFKIKGTKSSSKDDSNDSSKEKARTLFHKAFTIIGGFKKYFPLILHHFLNLVNPQIISKYLPILFKTIRSYSYDYNSTLAELMSFFGPDTRKELFESVYNEQPPSATQLHLLMVLQSNKTTLEQLSALAMQLASSSKSSSDRNAGASFFSLLAKKQPDQALRFLETATLYLSCPPENNPTLDSDIHGFSLIIVNILENINDKNYYSNKIAVNINNFFNRIFDTKSPDFNSNLHFYDAGFIAAFTIMISLPNYLIPSQQITENVKLFMDYIKKTSNTITNVQHQEKIVKIANEIAKFFSIHNWHELTATFFIFLMKYPILHSKSNILSIANSAFKVLDNSQNLVIIAKHILLYALKEPSPHIDFIMSHISRPLLNISQFITNKSFIDDFDEFNMNNEIKAETFNYQILVVFPKVICALPKNEVSSFLKQYILNSFAGSNSYMMQGIFLSLCSDEHSVKLLCEEFPSLILNMIREEKNLFRVQILSECISKWVNSHPGFLSDVISSTNKLETHQKCLIYSSLFSNVNIESSIMVSMMNDLDSIAMNSGLNSNNYNVIFSLHALSVLYNLYSVQLSEMTVADLQLNVILSLLNANDKAVDPYSLNYIALCFINLLPVLSSDIQYKNDSLNSQLLNGIKIATQCFIQLQPLAYAKEVMFRVIQNVIIFAKDAAVDFINSTNLEIPKSKSSVKLLTSAFGAFSDMMKIFGSSESFKQHNYHFIDNLSYAFILLQRTRNQNVSDFIESVASDFSINSLNLLENKGDSNQDQELQKINKRIIKCISAVKSILTNNSLPLNGKVTIETNDSTRACALTMSKSFVPILAKIKPTLGECVDDLITSIIRSIETERTHLMNKAYDLLFDILVNFDKIKVDGGQKLLELYDSQLFIAVKFAFDKNCDLCYSGKMLIKYIDFKFNLLEDSSDSLDDFKVLANLYAQCLANVSLNNENECSYFNVGTHLCILIRSFEQKQNKITQNSTSSKEDFFEQFQKYKSILLTQLCEIISISMALWKSNSEDWDQMNQFKRNFSPIYNDIVSTFIWIQSLSDKNSQLISIDILFDFYTDEIKTGTEYWRVAASINALKEIVNYYVNSNNNEEYKDLLIAKIEDAIKATDKAKEISPKLASDIIPQFLKACSKATMKSTSLLSIINFVKESDPDSFHETINEFNVKNFAKLLNESETNEIDINFSDIIYIIKVLYENQEIDDEECIALFTLIIEKSSSINDKLLDYMFQKDSKVFAQLKFIIYRRIIKRFAVPEFQNSDFDRKLRTIALFSLANFKLGGMDLMAQILIDEPYIGLKLFLVDSDLKVVTDLCLNDSKNCAVYIQFITFGFQVYVQQIRNQNIPRFSNFEQNVAKFAFIIMNKWCDDIQFGCDIVFNAVVLINLLMSEDGGLSVKTIFSSLGNELQRITVDKLGQQIVKIENKKKVQNLMVFSNTKRRTQEDDEWQSLDDSDDFE